MDREFSIKDSHIVKGAAILLLLNYHLFKDAQAIAEFNVDYRPLSLESFLTISGFGNICVAIFIFLTAYGITKGLIEQEGIKTQEMYAQAIRRLWKLMGKFFSVFVGVMLVWFPFFDCKTLYGEGKQGILCMLADSTGISQILDTPTLNETWWYMWIAYVLIFLVPLLYLLVEKTGYPMMVLVFLCPVVLELHPILDRYLFTAAAGVCVAYGDLLNRIINIKIYPILRWGLGIAGFIVCILVRQNTFVQEHILHLADAGIVVFLIWFLVVCPGKVPVVRNILEFIGRHSGNIFMVHTFFYLILWRRYIYAFHYAGGILVVLLSVSLIWSIILEWIKKGFFNIWLFLKKVKRPE